MFQQKRPFATDTNTKNKRTKTLMDLIEDNLAESNGEPQQPTGEAVAVRPAKTDDDQEYEQWKMRMLEEAGQQ